jgi:nucleotide-binding universal stress UspA family protein
MITTATGGIMKRFKNILFFADGSEEMSPALQRVGIPRLFIGNTAEEIIQTTKCSVLAVKPTGFISPVE